MILLQIFGLILFASFLLIVFRGAPFVPTRGRDIDAIFSLYRFRPGDVLVDLGSGDGRVLAAAARRGIHAIGYELNPFLVWYSRLKLRGHQGVTVRLEDFWLNKLPEETAVVFVFLAGPFMAKLDHKLTSEASRLGHDIILISYGMKLPHKDPKTIQSGMLVYRYHPEKA